MNSNQTENSSSSITASNDEIEKDRDRKIDKSTTRANNATELLVAKKESEKESGARNTRSTLVIVKKIFQI